MADMFQGTPFKTFYTLLRDRKNAKIVVNISFVDALTALLNHQNELSFVVQQVLDNPGVQEVSTGALIQIPGRMTNRGEVVMHVTIIQSILVIIFGFFMNYERWVSAIGLWQALLCGVITGLLCGDVTTGLYVGGTLQLMTLGVSSFGGASVPDYPAAAIVGHILQLQRASVESRGYNRHPSSNCDGSTRCFAKNG